MVFKQVHCCLCCSSSNGGGGGGLMISIFVLLLKFVALGGMANLSSILNFAHFVGTF